MRKKLNYLVLLCLGILLASGKTLAEQSANEKDEENQSALDRRIESERSTQYKPFVLSAYRPNYVLPITYFEKPDDPSSGTSDSDKYENYEIKFQISIKYPIVYNLFGGQNSLQFAYTNLSFWQAFESSSPIRATNHEPELFMAFNTDWKFLGLKNRIVQLGYAHQSNGESGDESRSWNFIYANFILERGNFYLSVKPWYRVRENGSDDNPDIEEYVGHGEIRGVYAGSKHTLSLMVRNNFHSQNHGAVEIDWSYPLKRRTKWMIQYFSGYGESLNDYDTKINRIGIGIALTDWL